MNRTDFQQLADMRAREAKILLDNGYFAGAYYLAGYAIECALKACIAKRVKEFDFPDKKLAEQSYSHDLTALLIPSRMKDLLESEIRSTKGFGANWDVKRLG